MKMTRIFFAICLGALVSTQAAAYDDLDVSAGTMSLGGALSFPMNFPKGGAPEVRVGITPSFGYFFVDGVDFFVSAKFERVLKASATNTFGGSPVDLNNHWGVGVGINYYIDLGSPAFPYLGANGDFAWNGDGTDITATVPLGVLVSLNEHVAIDFGIPVGIKFGVGKALAANNGYAGISINPGYLGVKAFF